MTQRTRRRRTCAGPLPKEPRRDRWVCRRCGGRGRGCIACDARPSEALTWAAQVAEERGRPIGSIQFWGHGTWGRMIVGKTSLDQESIGFGHPLAPVIDRFRAQLAGPEAVFWLRAYMCRYVILIRA